MNKIDDVTVQELLEYIKTKTHEGETNHIVHQITYWYHDYIATIILREHRQ